MFLLFNTDDIGENGLSENRKKYLIYCCNDVRSGASGGHGAWKRGAANTSKGPMRKACQAPSLESAVKTEEGRSDQLLTRAWRPKLVRESWSGLEKLVRQAFQQEAGLTWFDCWSGAYGG